MAEGVDEVAVVGDRVEKRHGGPGGAARAARAASALRAAAEVGVPVPEVLGCDGGLLVTRYVPGRPGQEVLATDPAAVLRAVGDVARRVRVSPPPTRVPVADDRGTWVHGDLCPANLLLGSGGELVAVVDWVDSRVDDPLVDVVWTEWLVRTHHASAIDQLPALWESSNLAWPGPDVRRSVMAYVLRHRLAVEGPQRVSAWRAHLTALPELSLT